MSAQQVFCWTAGADSPGRIGVKEARLTANTPNNNRPGSVIDHNLSPTKLFQRRLSIWQMNARFDRRSKLCYKKSDVEQNHDFGGYGSGTPCRTSEHLCPILHSLKCGC
jgi:hypothetical protein